MLRVFSSTRSTRPPALAGWASILPLVLLGILILRGLSLEYGDLIDPTETRYATIAENMLFSGDWITPRLQTENGLEPYLSKPPLHFWLTALSYTFFGIDEWTSRLPSFLALLLIVSSMLVFSKRFLTRELGYAASIVCATSPLMFFLSGSSTVDVTFAAFVTAALTAFAVTLDRNFKNEKTLATGLMFFGFSALAFLTKGPAALILIGIPVAGLCIYDRSISSLKALPWVSGTVTFLALAVPWFYLIEKSTPGSVWYFFVHENFLRFLVKDYGGRHGEAHARPYGSIWWMMILAMFPWSLILLRKLWQTLTALYRSTLKQSLPQLNRWQFFMLASGLAPLLFFTVARSILPAYTLPAIPGLSLLIVCLVMNSSVLAEAAPDLNAMNPIASSSAPLFAKTGSALTAAMLIGLYFAAPYIEVNKSSSELLELIARHTKKERPTVGTIATNNYSPFWTSGAFEEELSKPMDIVYVDPDRLEESNVRHVIVRDSGGSDFLENHGDNYRRIDSEGKWTWYRKKMQH